jgi:hypothetical protein
LTRRRPDKPLSTHEAIWRRIVAATTRVRCGQRLGFESARWRALRQIEIEWFAEHLPAGPESLDVLRVRLSMLTRQRDRALAKLAGAEMAAARAVVRGVQSDRTPPRASGAGRKRRAAA